ncbi:MAG: ABC transporter ATP-binding protein [Clostridia bacterium]|nr:ABC transporter ATP-binding protein [Clostridia bacterium]
MIELSNVNKYYSGKSVHVLKDVSLTIDKGELVAVTGSSGSGKSTLMNIIGCLDVPSTGRYELLGDDVMKMSEKKQAYIRNREIGFIFQGFNLIHALNAAENVQLPLIYRGVPPKQRRELARKALKMVGLEKRMTHKPYELSGGQQQRVAIARAIAAKPPIILADEPTGNLDSASGEIVLEALTRLNDIGKTVILITHDDKVANMAKRKIKISDGRVVV